MTDKRIVLTTAGSEEEAQKIARCLVERRKSHPYTGGGKNWKKLANGFYSSRQQPRHSAKCDRQLGSSTPTNSRNASA
jgi:hypothetical protein